ncbi:hypothetical protein LTR37_014362 [Vermiconidia calcicola]|uniref:Uncharacterized protein n=1 Tax=Vermiconidia calcicola TaxID=1690605 RepID=A0ACC3MTT7_9PEZI|nr:hypothetical protein LTR37_014362 [Vermiconidia calcicola]
MKLIDPAIHEGFLNCATNNAWSDRQNFWFSFRNGQDTSNKFGTRFFDLWCETGQSSVHRARFLDELVALVPNELAHFGKKLDNAEDKVDHVVLHFEDGTTAKHSAVIGCDGVKSRLREVVLGKDHPAAKPVFSGKYAYRGLIPMEDAAALMGDELARNSQMYFGHGGHILTFPIEKGKTMNVVAFSTKEDGKWDDEVWVVPMDKGAMFKDFTGWTDSVQKCLSMMQKPDIWALFDHPPAPTYTKGRICILGDAAHAGTPHNGAGAGQAIEDALCMSRLMRLVYDGVDIPRAFAAFDRVRRPRSQRQVQMARDSGWLYDLQLPGYMDDWDKIKQMLEEKQNWIWNHDLEAENKEAERVFNEETSKL